MKTTRTLPLLILSVLLLLALGLPAFHGLAAPAPGPVFLPLLLQDNRIGTPPGPSDGALVADHTRTDLSRIPPAWLEAAKTLAFHYAHTSHGSQIVTGLLWLETVDPRYAVAVRYASGSAIGLPNEPGALRIFDGNPPETYIGPEDYWSTPEGVERTRQVARSGLFDFSMWSWCGQQSSNSAVTVNQYLAALAGLEAEFPGMRFILMTGHSDVSNQATLERNNDLVRVYAQDHDLVLFDFGDLERYDPAGNYYAGANDSCPWCPAWCAAHPQDCAGLETMGDCAHSHKLQCKLKAQAFWWLLARLAGWDGE